MHENVLTVTETHVHAGDLQPHPIDTDALTALEGEALFEAVFSTDDLRQWYDDLDGPLILDLPDSLQHISWEGMHDGEDEVALNRGIVRVVDTDEDAGSLAADGDSLEVLVALASPILSHDQSIPPHDDRQPSPLDLEARVRMLHDLSGYAADAEFDVMRHVDWVSLQTQLAFGRDILHLSAHGDGNRIHLEERDYRACPVGTTEIAREAVRAGVRFAILDNCHSAEVVADSGPSMALSVSRAGVPAVMGMNGAVWADGADRFTQQLYEMVLRGMPVGEAVRLARLRMQQDCRGRPQVHQNWHCPVLFIARDCLEDFDDPLCEFADDSTVTLSGDTGLWPIHGDRPSDTFTGRRDKIRHIAECIDPETPSQDAKEKVILTGHGGIGKTELALQTADRLRFRFDDGLVFVGARTERPDLEIELPGGDELQVISSGREFVTKLARRLDIDISEIPGDAALVKSVATAANARPVLLVLDNLETVRDEPIIRSLLRGLGGTCCVIVTSRETIHECGLHEIPVNQLHPDEARLLVRRLSAEHGVRIQRQTRMAEVCRFTPAPIRLAVARIEWDRQTEEQVIASFEQFTGPASDIAEYAFNDQLEVATENEKWVFACAAIFPDPVRREALQAATGLDDEAFGEALAGACALNLVEPDRDTDRFELLPLARTVAEDILCEHPPVDEAKLRAAEECAEYLRPIDQAFGSAAAHHAFRQLDAEHGNAMSLAEHAFQQAAWEAVVQLEDSLTRFLKQTGRYDDALVLHTMGFGASERRDDPIGTAHAQGDIANIHKARGQYERAVHRYEEILKVFDEQGDRAGTAKTLTNIADIRQIQGEYHRAMKLYEQSLQTFQDLGDLAGAATTLNNMAGFHRDRGNYGRAIELYEKSLRAFRELGDLHRSAQTLSNMATVHWTQGDYELAMELCEESLRTFEKLDDPVRAATTLGNMADVHRARREYDRAMELYQQILRKFEEIGDRAHVALTLSNMATIHLQRGEYDRAMQLYEQSLQTCEELGDRAGAARCLVNIGSLSLEMNDGRAAQRHWKDALDRMKGLGLPLEEKVRTRLENLEDFYDWLDEEDKAGGEPPPSED